MRRRRRPTLHHAVKDKRVTVLGPVKQPEMDFMSHRGRRDLEEDANVCKELLVLELLVTGCACGSALCGATEGASTGEGGGPAQEPRANRA